MPYQVFHVVDDTVYITIPLIIEVFFCGVSSLTWTRYGYDILVDSKLKP